MKNESADHKVALIPGCSSGIGYDLADRLTEAGYTVVATARQIGSLEKLNAAMKLTLDVTDELSINSALAETMKAYGRLDILVNNAGFRTPHIIKNKNIAEIFVHEEHHTRESKLV